MGKKVKVENSLSTIMGTSSRLLNNKISKNMGKYHVTVEQWVILASLWRHDGQSQQTLANMVSKNKASITHLIDNLEKRKLVSRKADPNDRRNKRVYLTEEGKSLQEELVKVVKETTREATHDIDKKDLKSAKKVMKKMIDRLSLD
ncbi:DNA-binding MarR family transcriptional regulator [Catalinimonas alkaloidigena]|uniref:MarR family winged helix-turn-helix transcriptional regulator n=1 Tax=Catalinimonas alkaloidigena TaxID=1075417 RepID=UPI0024068541|nr:MarR family transcriptional regulator [Catalinimonas alkaloidigena]MDF9795248.1 DNA-binding MarR family transcriptional regulator [Catalinimonas alkaloidigena]